jgi:hypothetical protein
LRKHSSGKGNEDDRESLQWHDKPPQEQMQAGAVISFYQEQPESRDILQGSLDVVHAGERPISHQRL